MRFNVFFARFPFGGSEHPDTTDWLVATVLKAKSDRRIDQVFHQRYDDTPITMTRNRCLKDSLASGADILCMIDSDMRPDLPLPLAEPFWDSSLEFLLAHRGPCCVGAPYCGPPPHENVYVFKWATEQSDHPNADFSVQQFDREDAWVRSGIQEVAALPTGLILIDLRAVKVLRPPWFAYEYTDEYQTHKASTEDVFFTRNLALAGVKQYCNWDAWAGHHKRKCVGKPDLLNADAISVQMREAILADRKIGERLIDRLPDDNDKRLWEQCDRGGLRVGAVPLGSGNGQRHPTPSP